MTCRSFYAYCYCMMYSDPLVLCSTFIPNLPLLSPPRPVTADDLERDRVLTQRIELFKWVKPLHLDTPELESDDPLVAGFLDFARQGIVTIYNTAVTLT